MTPVKKKIRATSDSAWTRVWEHGNILLIYTVSHRVTDPVSDPVSDRVLDRVLGRVKGRIT